MFFTKGCTSYQEILSAKTSLQHIEESMDVRVSQIRKGEGFLYKQMIDLIFQMCTLKNLVIMTQRLQ